MRACIITDEELVHQVAMYFAGDCPGDEAVEIWLESSGIDVPNEQAKRWKNARDLWKEAQKEATEFLVASRRK